MEIKKVIFVNVMDIINVPSKENESKDCTDFQLKLGFVEALKKNKSIIRVNLLDFKNDLLTFNEMDDRMGMLRVIGYWLLVCTGLAASTFAASSYNGNKDECLKAAVEKTHDNNILSDESSWLFVGLEEQAEKYGMDYISMEDFTNGANTDIEGAEAAEEG